MVEWERVRGHGSVCWTRLHLTRLRQASPCGRYISNVPTDSDEVPPCGQRSQGLGAKVGLDTVASGAQL